MNHKQRNASIEKHLKEIKKLLCTKGLEYSNSEEANNNFYKLGQELGLDPKQILWVYHQKHNQSISQFIRTGETKSNESIEGRIYDEIAYDLILLTLIESEK